MLKSVFSRRAFTMVELLASIAIIAVIAALVFAFVGNYVDYARLTAARHTVAVLNESLNEYRTLGGISKAHSLEGTAGTTLNSSTLTDTVINAMKEGFTVGGAKKSFISANSTQLDTALIGTTGQGARLRFVVDTTEASGGAGSVPEEIEITPVLTVSATPCSYGDSSSTVTVSTTTAGLVGQTVTLGFNGNTSYATAVMGADNMATFTIDINALSAGTYALSASVAGFTSGTTHYLTASATNQLTLNYGSGTAYMSSSDNDFHSPSMASSTGYIAFKDATGTITIKSTSSSISLASSASFTFWPCKSATNAEKSGSITSVTRSGGSQGWTSSIAMDLRGLNALTSFSTDTYPLASLQLPEASSLQSITVYCSSKTPSLSIKNLSNLNSVYCSANGVLASITVDNCPLLTSIPFYGNVNLSVLNINNCATLATVNVHDCKLTSLHISDCPALTKVYCYNNTPLVGSATALQSLFESLPTVTSATIYLGTAASKTTTYDSIATAKGWIIKRTNS